jgi:hypothetical protein
MTGPDHMLFAPQLSSKLVGGGSCRLECEWRREDSDELPTGTRERFALRDKPATIVRLAEGASFRDPSASTVEALCQMTPRSIHQCSGQCARQRCGRRP